MVTSSYRLNEKLLFETNFELGKWSFSESVFESGFGTISMAKNGSKCKQFLLMTIVYL